MLSKVFRFHGHNSVRQSYKQGSSVRNSLGSLHVRADQKNPRFKVAIVVSKKVSKSAVVRNRIRRRIFEIVRLEQPNLTHPAELVFTVYQIEAATIPAEELKKQVTELLQRVKLL